MIRLALLLGGCAAEATPSGLAASTFALEPGRALQHAPIDDPASEATRWLVGVGDTWELRAGESADGELIEALDVSLSGDLAVEGAIVLPASVSVGAAAGDAVVRDVGPFDGWYGTFDPAAVVEVTAGRAAGEWVFAPGFGPIRYALDGASWELVSYDGQPP
ncbi:MAG: hypothetical protein H0V89_01130 [Deltaproteobacteria bacterium]|nr:hypothetical protein [Deltaproteobacteria bacterium]